jgi:hypothetical protein
MKLIRDEAGQTLVLSAFLMCCLMGFMALAIDVGVAFRTQRRVQTQADSAAVAAALCATYGGQFCTRYGGTDVNSVASGAATSNGMPSGASFALNNPPSFGQHSNSGYYEAVISQPSSAVFVGAFTGLFSGGSNNNFNVGARAVAGMVPGTTCLYVLNDTADKSLYVKGSAKIGAPYCSIQVNSSASDAICTTGGATIDTGQLLVVGSQGGSGNCNGTQSNVQSGKAAENPLAGLVEPDQGCNSDASKGAVNVFGFGAGATDTLGVDSTSGALTLTNTATGAKMAVTTAPYSPSGSGGPAANVACFSDANVQVITNIGTDTNSAWVFQNGVNVAGSSLITINGTLEVAGGDFQEANTNLFIHGPTGLASDQPYTGMALLVPSTGVTCPSSINSMGTVPAGDGCLDLQFGSGGSPPTQTSNKCAAGSTTPGIVGTVYAPKDVLYMQDNGGCLSVTNLIADEIWNKSSDLEIYNYNLAYTTSPLDVVRLVE